MGLLGGLAWRAFHELHTTQKNFITSRRTGTVTELGRLDTILNNAGLMLIGPVADAPSAEWDRMIDVNLRAMLSVTRAALPHLVKAAADSARRRGHCQHQLNRGARCTPGECGLRPNRLRDGSAAARTAAEPSAALLALIESKLPLAFPCGSSGRRFASAS
jgi:NAD(P)-dependent dehydrogenase (short-subunit alcohol dehydrogenase family)